MAQLTPINLSWLGGGIGGMLKPGRDTNAGGSIYGGKRTLGKDFLEGVGGATDPEFKSASKKARSLRSYLGELDPSMKDKLQTMSGDELEGQAMKLAKDRMAAMDRQKSEADYLKLVQTADEINAGRRQRDSQTAGEAALGRYMQAFGQPSPPESLQAPGFSLRNAALQAAGPDLAKAPAANVRALAEFMPEMASDPAQWDVNKEAVPGMSLVAKRGSQVWQAFPSEGGTQTVTVRDPNGLPYTYIPNPKSGAMTPVGSNASTLSAAQVEENLRLAQRDADDTSKLLNLVKGNPEFAKQFSVPDLETKLQRSRAEVQRFEALRKGGGGASAEPPAVRSWDPVKKQWMQ